MDSSHRGRNLLPVEIVGPEPPSGQQFILRHYLREVFGRAPFKGDAWTSCMSAFLQVPGIPLLMHNGVTQAPASFFLNLYTTREPTYRSEGKGQWGESELRRRLRKLGEQRLAMLIISDPTRSWAIYLNEALDEVLAYHGRALPGPRYSIEDDDQDVAGGIFVRHLVTPSSRTEIVKLDQSEPMVVKVELAEDSGRRYEMVFNGWRRMSVPPPGRVEIAGVDELRGPSGRTWFVFQSAEHVPGRRLAIQADRATVTPNVPMTD